MHQTEQEYTHDNGYKSRKFLLAVGSIAALVIVGLLYSKYGWGIEIYSTMATSVVAVALGYMGIKAGRDAVPRAAHRYRRVEKKEEFTQVEEHSNTVDREEV